LPGADGIAVLKQVRESDPDCPVIVMTAFGTIENAVEAMKLGAYDFIQKPIDVDHLLILLRRCQEHRELRHENLLLKEEFQRRHGLPAIVGESPRIVDVSRDIQKVAPTDSTVLIQGESGTGKELFARAIHQLRARKEDIDALTDFFLQKFARELNKRELSISDEARSRLRQYQWPGNICELENCIERAAILCNESRIEAADLHLSGETSD